MDITGHIGDIPIYPIFRHSRIAKIPSSHIKVLRVGPNCSIGTLQWQLISATSADQLQILRNVHSHISDDVWDTVSGQDSGRYLPKCVLFFEVACVFMNPLTFSSPAGNYFLVWFGKFKVCELESTVPCACGQHQRMVFPFLPGLQAPCQVCRSKFLSGLGMRTPQHGLRGRNRLWWGQNSPSQGRSFWHKHG